MRLSQLAGEDLEPAFGDEVVEDVEQLGAVVVVEFGEDGEAIAEA